MNDQHFCEEWAEKLAARHQEDLTQQEHQELEDHLATCEACMAQFQIYQSLEARIRELASPEMPPSLLPLLHAICQRDMRLPVPLAIRQPKESNNSPLPTGRRLALVAGVNTVAHEPDLPYAERDALNLAAVLQQYAGCQLVIPPLTGEEATTYNIKIFLARLAQECRENDEVVIYFSGHGYATQTEYQSSEFTQLAYDSDSSESGVMPHQGLSPLLVEMLSQWVKENLSAKRVLIILDCCISARAAEEKEAGEPPHWIRERVAQYFDRAEGQNGKYAPRSLTLKASAVNRTVCRDPNSGESFPNFLRHALLRKNDWMVDRSTSNKMIDLQQVFHRYLELTSK